MSCIKCDYFYYDSRTEVEPYCHFNQDSKGPDDIPPCEYEDYEEE